MSLLGQLTRVVRGALSRREEVHVRVSDDVTATIYDRPGEWMDDAALSHLRRELLQVAAAAVPGTLDYGVFRPERAPYANRLIVVGRSRREGRAVGFNALPMLDVTLAGRAVRVLHLGLLVVDPRCQRQGLLGLLYGLGAFSLLHRLQERPVWVSSVTEVPAVFGAVAEQFIDVYPDFRSARPPPPLHLELARALMREHRHEFGVGPEAGFDEAHFVIRGSYTGGSGALKKRFEDAPAHRHEAANAFCRAHLDYARGDDFLQVGQLDGTVISNWMGRRLPPGLRPQAARLMQPWGSLRSLPSEARR